MVRRPSPPRFALQQWVIGLAAASMALIVGAAAWRSLQGREDRIASELVQSHEPSARLRGAQIAAGSRTPRTWQLMAASLSGPVTESDPAVREAFVYALGQSREARYFDVVADLARQDSDPYVRLTAWLAAARLDANRLPGLVSQAPRPVDPWDQIALASAWLEAGDARGVETLLDWAVRGSEPQRWHASLALFRGLAPLLEAAGRWPLEAEIHEGRPWSAELVAEVRRRCQALSLQALLEDSRPHALRAVQVRRNIGRLNGMRQRLVRLLFDE